MNDFVAVWAVAVLVVLVGIWRDLRICRRLLQEAFLPNGRDDHS